MAWNSRISGSACTQADLANSRCSDHLPIYRAVASRTGPPPPPPIPISDPNTPKPKDDPPKTKLSVAKKDTKKTLKGVVVKKKSKVPETGRQMKGEGGSKPAPPAPTKDSPGKADDEKRPAKKQKVK